MRTTRVTHGETPMIAIANCERGARAGRILAALMILGTGLVGTDAAALVLSPAAVTVPVGGRMAAS